MKRKTMAMWRNLLPARGMDLETADGREVYFHLNSVLDDSFDRLTVESEVRFVEEMGEKDPQASTVHLVGKHLSMARAGVMVPKPCRLFGRQIRVGRVRSRTVDFGRRLYSLMRLASQAKHQRRVDGGRRR